MKIQPENLQSIATTQTQKSAELASTNKTGNSGSKRIDHSGEDHLEISSFANQVSQASAVHGANRAQRVKELTSLYQSGRYQVDSSKVSKALVNNVLGSNPSGKP